MGWPALFEIDDQFSCMPCKYGDACFLQLHDNATRGSLNAYTRVWDPRAVRETYGKHYDNMMRYKSGVAGQNRVFATAGPFASSRDTGS